MYISLKKIIQKNEETEKKTHEDNKGIGIEE